MSQEQQYVGGSLESDIVPPDRSSSSSAPPALQLATESLFAFRVEYAKIFSDIRAHEDYFSFYETNKEKGRNLPPPLDPTPFLFDMNNEDPQDIPNRYFGSLTSPSDSYSDLHLAQQAFQQMNLNNKGMDIWNPARLRKGPFNNSFSDLNYASSPSAQTALNTANFIWKDEESNNYMGEMKADPRLLESLAAQSLYGNGNNNLQKDNGFDNEMKNENDDASSPRSNVLCRYYASGYCSRGDKCFYSHDIQNSLPPEPLTSPAKPQAVPAVVAPVTTTTTTATSLVPPPSTQETKGNQRQSKSQKGTPRKGNAGNQSNGNTASPHKGASQERLEPSTSAVSPVSPRGGTAAASILTPISTSATGEPNYNFDQLIGRIYMVSKDQQGCRYLQKKLEEQEPEAIRTIFNEVYDHITELMTDPFGNYLCQKLLEFCNDHQRYLIVERVAPDLVYISKNMHGTRAVQKMIECLSSPAQVNIIKEALRNSVVELIQDLNGNHVIQRCLNRLTPDDNQFIYDAVTTGNNCVEVATHRHGCCVLQRCIDHASNKQKVQLIQEITKNALVLVQDPYGNYVVQYILDLPFPDLVDHLARTFFGNIRILATQKFSSNVVEKCLGSSGPEVRTLMVREILSEKANFLSMLQDPFANYVIQTALTVADPQQHVDLVESIKPHLNQLRNTPYGKRIQSKIAKETAERARDKR